MPDRVRTMGRNDVRACSKLVRPEDGWSPKNIWDLLKRGCKGFVATRAGGKMTGFSIFCPHKDKGVLEVIATMTIDSNASLALLLEYEKLLGPKWRTITMETELQDKGSSEMLDHMGWRLVTVDPQRLIGKWSRIRLLDYSAEVK